jgi:hypothetical protein
MTNEFNWDLEDFNSKYIELIIKSASIYNGQNEDIKKSIKLYTAMKKNKEDYELEIIANKLRTKNIINNKTINKPIDDIQLIDHKDRINSYLNNELYKDLFNYFNKIIPKLLTTPINFIDYKYKNIKLSDNELYENTIEFYKHLDKEWLNIFENTFNNKNLIDIRYVKTIKNGYKGMCYFDNYNKIPYLYILRDNTIADIYNIRHESNHAISNISNGNIYECNSFYRNMLSEINAYFIELISDDELNIKKYNKKEINNFQNNRASSAFNNFNFLYINLLISKLNNAGIKDNLIEKVLNTLDIADTTNVNNIIINAIDNTIFKYSKYSLSFLIALDLYNQYNKDKDQAIYNIKKIMLYKNEDLKTFLNSINIELDDYYQLNNYKNYIDNIKQKRLILNKK